MPDTILEAAKADDQLARIVVEAREYAQRAMRNGALMPELNEYEPACTVNGICYALPPCCLSRVVYSWSSKPPLSLFAYKGTLRYDQASSGPLRVILSYQPVRNLPLVLSPSAPHRHHDNAIFEFRIAERIGRKEYFDRFV